MDYYHQKFHDLQEEFQEVMEKYPLFQEDIDKINNYDIKEIDELLKREGDYYFKRALDKLEDLIKDIKDKSTHITKVYKEYEELVEEWQKIDGYEIDESSLLDINKKVEQSGDLINRPSIKDIDKAIVLINEAIKELKEYVK